MSLGILLKLNNKLVLTCVIRCLLDESLGQVERINMQFSGVQKFGQSSIGQQLLRLLWGGGSVSAPSYLI